MKTTTTTPLPIEGIHHITLPVHDLKSAEEFYIGLLGARVVRSNPHFISVQLGDAPELDLFLERERTKGVPLPHPHLAMRVDPDHLDDFVRRLGTAGVPVDGPRRLGPPGHASVYFADPFGNTLELVTLGYEGGVLEGPPDVSKLGW